MYDSLSPMTIWAYENEGTTKTYFKTYHYKHLYTGLPNNHGSSDGFETKNGVADINACLSLCDAKPTCNIAAFETPNNCYIMDSNANGRNEAYTEWNTYQKT